MRLYNSFTRRIEDFKPLNLPTVTLYTCGPTVYDYTHIGHMRTYTNNDVLKRSLKYLGYKVKHVMNITDVGHLTGDDDTGEDKLEKGAQKTGKTVWEVARFFTEFFFKTTDALNIIRPDIVCRATDHINEMIQFIKELTGKGYTYETSEAIYFDTTKFKNYGRLSGQKLEEKIKKAREETYIDPQKKHPADFVLWFRRVGRFANHAMYWNSPWGKGFPGWHIECSTMSMKYLGETIDIHAGGIDHLPVHHENEIAQSEAATGKQFVRFWFHNNFLQVNGQKMSKSLGNFYTIDDIKNNQIEPLALRLLFLQTHYRQPMNFTWQSAKGAQESFDKLKNLIWSLKKQSSRASLSEEKLEKIDQFHREFAASLENDLQTPAAVAVMWKVAKSNIPSFDKLDLLFDFDQVLGLRLDQISEDLIPEEVKKLARERELLRRQGNFKKADQLREEIKKKGYQVEDEKGKSRIRKITLLDKV